mmetsp:Transcript_1868/g.4283  ORF Transcript_1868/g.4283 Transcript_1868/m.4283 type:complete len:235 (+) Transcript_1868:1834-2538(+)
MAKSGNRSATAGEADTGTSMQLKFMSASGSLGAAPRTTSNQGFDELCDASSRSTAILSSAISSSRGRLRWARIAEIVADISSWFNRRRRDRSGWLRAPASVSRTRAALNGNSGNCRPAAMSSTSMSWVVVGVAAPPRQRARMPARRARPNDARRSSNVLQRLLMMAGGTLSSCPGPSRAQSLNTASREHSAASARRSPSRGKCAQQSPKVVARTLGTAKSRLASSTRTEQRGRN